MPVSKSKRKKKHHSQPPARRASEPEFGHGFPDDPLTDDFEDLDAALAAELDTDTAIADLKRAGKAFRPATLAAAEKVALEALGADRKGEVLELAARALQICPWCGDGYGLLAMAAGDHPQMALHFRRLAMAAAEFALDADWGQDLRKAYAGDYWSHVATRAYMRAALGLADTLAEMGELETAAAQYEALLQLNATDDQGVRYALANCLLMLGQDQRLADFLAGFEDQASTFVVFNRVVLAFRRAGDTRESRTMLADAMSANPHVMTYLIGDRALPPAEIEIHEPGSENEATFYVECTAESWRATPGAIEWLRRCRADRG